MALAKRPRKKYNPNKIQCNTPVVFRYTKEEGDALKFRVYFHLHQFQIGEGKAGDFLAIQFRLFVGEKLTKYFDDEALLNNMKEALHILKDIKLERMVSGKWTITEEQEQSIRYSLSLVDDMMDNSTRREQLPIFVSSEKQLDHSLTQTLP